MKLIRYMSALVGGANIGIGITSLVHLDETDPTATTGDYVFLVAFTLFFIGVAVYDYRKDRS